MANEIGVTFPVSGLNLYCIVRNQTNQVYRTDSEVFENWTAANFGNYDVSLTEQAGGSRFYVGDFPALGAGIYSIIVYQRAGGSPAVTDDVVSVISPFRWGGSAPESNVFDGLTLAEVIEYWIALNLGASTDPVDNEDGTFTIEYTARDGTTTKVTRTYKLNGAWPDEAELD